MSKEEDVKFLKIQTCVLKVNIHCDGCKQKVKKLLQKIDGVYTTSVDAEQGKVTVSGNVDPATLIKKLAKSGKHAEPWSSGKGGNNNNNNNNNFNNINQLSKQFQNMQIDNKGQKDAKSQKGSKDQKVPMQPLPQQLQQMQQMKGLKDMKLPQLTDMKPPFKDPKSVKFNLPEDEYLSDEFDDFDDDDLDDDFDDDFDEEEELMKLKDIKMKPMMKPMNGPGPGMPLMNPHAMLPVNEKKGGGGGGGNGHGNKPVQVPIKGGNNDGKNGNGGKKGGGNQQPHQNPNQNQNQNQNQGGGGGKNGGKNGGTNNKNPPTVLNGGGGGGAGNNNLQGGGKKGGGPPMNALGQGFHEMDLRSGAAPMPEMVHGNMPPQQNIRAVQGLPMNAGAYFQGAGPEIMPGNPYHQQYLAAMMLQQQQQQLLRQNGGERFHPMTYARPPPAVAYAPYMPAQYHPAATPEYAHFFSDENTSSCSVM